MERNTIMICVQKTFRTGRAKYIVNLGKNQKTETKVPDRTKGGREGKNAVVITCDYALLPCIQTRGRRA